MGRGCFERKSNVKKQDIWVMRVSHWLSCRSNEFLRGEALYIFFLSGPVIDDSFPLRILSFGL